MSAGGDEIKLTLSGGPREIDLAHVANIEQVNGPISWLSGRRRPRASTCRTSEPTSATRADEHELNGDPIRFKDRKFARGIGVHSYSRSRGRWTQDYVAFRTRYAMDPAAEVERADVTVRVKLDDKVVHEQEHVRPGVLSPLVVVDSRRRRSSRSR